MRHFLAARPIATRPIGMREPPSAAGLVTPSGSTQRVASGACGAVSGTVDLAAIAAAADQALGAATGETAGLIGPRGAQTGRPYVDERHDCRDIGPAYVSSTAWGTASMRDRQVGLGAVLAPQCRNATPPLVTASAAHALWRSRRHALTYPAIANMPLRQRTPAAGFTPPIQAARAFLARVQAAIGMGKEARMNMPGVAEGNWRWRCLRWDRGEHRFKMA